ncbi:MAG: hypothetical protein AAB400_04090 [Patescibacteria group bacterium]
MLKAHRAPLVAAIFLAGMLAIPGCQPGSHPAPSPTHKVGKPVSLIVQLRREKSRRIKAEAKVTELRKLLRQAKVRRTVAKSDATNVNVRHSGKVDLGGTVRLEIVAPADINVVPLPAPAGK